MRQCQVISVLATAIKMLLIVNVSVFPLLLCYIGSALVVLRLNLPLGFYIQKVVSKVQTIQGFPTRMVYLYNEKKWRYTILVGNP